VPEKPVIFFHSAALDGKCSAAIALRYERERFGRDCELYPINYGDPFPWSLITPRRTIYMLDFSLQPYSDMLRLGEECRKVSAVLHWIDHHRTAADEARASGPPLCSQGIVEEGQAGCELTGTTCTAARTSRCRTP